MAELMNEMNAQMAELPQWVHYWMNWMMWVFLASLLFVWKYKAARYVILAFALTLPLGMGMFYLSRQVHLIGIAHLVSWGPLLWYLVRYEVRREEFTFSSIYGVWLGLLMATIAISLVFDVYDPVMVVLGHK